MTDRIAYLNQRLAEMWQQIGHASPCAKASALIAYEELRAERDAALREPSTLIHCPRCSFLAGAQSVFEADQVLATHLIHAHLASDGAQAS